PAADAGGEGGAKDATVDVPALDAASDSIVEEGGSDEKDASFDALDDASEDGDIAPDASEDSPSDVGEGNAVDDDGGDDGPIEDGAADGVTVPDEPTCLEEPGLYADFEARTLAPGVRFYKPAFELWSDGAYKVRHVYFPEASTIDASDPDNWIFPVGSR